MLDPILNEEQQVITTRILRQFAGAALAIFAVLAVRHAFFTDRQALALVFALAAGVIGGLGLARPERIRLLYVALIALTTPIGRIVTYVVLAVLFYGIVTPLGFVLSLFRRDPLQVKRPKSGSHWLPKSAVADIRDYMRQS